MANSSTKKPLTGWHVLWMLVAFFGVTFAVNAFFTVKAVQSFRGEDVKGSYRQGLEYNQTIAARDTQAALGWQAKTNIIAGTAGAKTLIVKLENKDGMGIADAALSAVLRHPTDLSEDRVLEFSETTPGRYIVPLGGVVGQWDLRAEATRGEARFKFEQSLWVE